MPRVPVLPNVDIKSRLVLKFTSWKLVGGKKKNIKQSARTGTMSQNTINLGKSMLPFTVISGLIEPNG